MDPAEPLTNPQARNPTVYELMHSSLRHYYVLFCILSLSKSAALPALVSINANLDLLTPTGTNLSDMLPDLPTKDFQYIALYRGSVLPDIACMMVCVFAMRELALLPDFGARLSGKTWIMDDYPQVAMSVGNPGETTVRWAMWTITAAIRDMMTHNEFRASQFNGIYLDIRVGVVRFFAPNTIETGIVANQTEHAVPQISEAASTATHTPTVSISFDVSDLKLNATSNADEMWADLTYRTKKISRFDVFMAIIWTLLNLAPHKDNESVRIVTIPNAAITASVTVSFSRVAGIPPRLQPLQYGNAVSLTAKLPEVLLRDNMFREMDIAVKEEGVVVARGTVRSMALTGFVGVPLSANVSVS